METVAERFERLFREYRGRVFAFALRFTGNREDALDLTQDVFLKVYTALERNGIQRESAWIYRIATNTCIDWLRRRRREGLRCGMEVEILDSRWEESKEKEARDLLKEALKSLSPTHRRVILLRWLKGLSYREIAEKMGCSLGTVMSRLHYARKYLRHYLKTLSSA